MKNKSSYTYRSLWPKSDLKPRAVDITSKFCRNLALVQKVLESGDTDRISRIFLNKPDVKGLFRRPTYTDDKPPDDTSQYTTTHEDATAPSDETEPSDSNNDAPATDVPIPAETKTDGGQMDDCATDSPAAAADKPTEPSVTTLNIDSTGAGISEATVNSDIAAETENADLLKETIKSDDAVDTDTTDLPAATMTPDIAVDTDMADMIADETVPADQHENKSEDAVVDTNDCKVVTTTSSPTSDVFPDEYGLTDVGNVSICVDHGDIADGTSATTETTIADDVAVTLASPDTTTEDDTASLDISVTSSDNVVGDQASPEEMAAASPDVMNADDTPPAEYSHNTEPSLPASPGADVAAAIADLNKAVPAVNEIHNSEIDVLYNEYGQLQKLGKGFYGMVYLVKCKYSGEVLVCKELCAELSIMEYMETEAKLLRLLRPTGAVPYFVGVIKNVRHTGNYGIIQGQVPDVVTLEDLLSGKYHLDKLRLILIALNLVDAVRKVHELAVIHNDIKPDNILVQKSTAKVRLIDFGLASYKVGISCDIAPGEESRFQHVAPELYHFKSSFGSDIFSLGFVLKAMLERVGDTTLDRLVQMCRENDIDDRPSLEYITQRLTTVKDKWVLEWLKERHARKMM